MLGLVLYQTAAGASPVARYMEEQDASTRAVLLEKMQAFCEEFPDVRTVSIKRLRGKVWEMRVRDPRGRQHRLLYAVVGKDLVALHAFTKKTQKTPPGDLEVAEHRLRQMLG
jgi:phage-related protein